MATLDAQFYQPADQFFPANASVALTYDDVTLATLHSDVLPRDAKLDTQLHERLALHLPIVSADMDTVTEAPMAIAMARAGGLGLIHCNMPERQQLSEVSRVKNNVHGLIQDPIEIGPDLLIAAPPYPDKLDKYDIEFPSDTWYDYWSGQPLPKSAKVARDPKAPLGPTEMVPLVIGIHPNLATLPVFVRGGAILPIAPLTQSTNETPQGPLTLRVYAGDRCAGHLYTDDGKTYAYKNGASLHIDFQCHVTADGFRLEIGEHQGSFPAWWQQIRVEIYGWLPRKRAVRFNGKSTDAALDISPNQVRLTMPDDGRSEVLELE